MVLCCLKQVLYVFDRFVFSHALPDHASGNTLGAQEIVLRVGDDQCGALRTNLHSRVGKPVCDGH